MTHITELQSQVNNLTKLQSNMNDHLHALSKNYHSVIQDLINFQKNMIAQDQLMQNLVQYLVNLEAGGADFYKSYFKYNKNIYTC